ncbi:MAG: hypothetical protein EOO24_04330, partial [Comamonadaceae bacterium]
MLAHFGHRLHYRSAAQAFAKLSYPLERLRKHDRVYPEELAAAESLAAGLFEAITARHADSRTATPTVDPSFSLDQLAKIARGYRALIQCPGTTLLESGVARVAFTFIYERLLESEPTEGQREHYAGAVPSLVFGLKTVLGERVLTIDSPLLQGAIRKLAGWINAGELTQAASDRADWPFYVSSTLYGLRRVLEEARLHKADGLREPLRRAVLKLLEPICDGRLSAASQEGLVHLLVGLKGMLEATEFLEPRKKPELPLRQACLQVLDLIVRAPPPTEAAQAAHVVVLGISGIKAVLTNRAFLGADEPLRRSLCDVTCSLVRLVGPEQAASVSPDRVAELLDGLKIVLDASRFLRLDHRLTKALREAFTCLLRRVDRDDAARPPPKRTAIFCTAVRGVLEHLTVLVADADLLQEVCLASIEVLGMIDEAEFPQSEPYLVAAGLACVKAMLYRQELMAADPFFKTRVTRATVALLRAVTLGAADDAEAQDVGMSLSALRGVLEHAGVMSGPELRALLPRAAQRLAAMTCDPRFERTSVRTLFTALGGVDALLEHRHLPGLEALPQQALAEASLALLERLDRSQGTSWQLELKCFGIAFDAIEYQLANLGELRAPADQPAVQHLLARVCRQLLRAEPSVEWSGWTPMDLARCFGGIRTVIGRRHQLGATADWEPELRGLAHRVLIHVPRERVALASGEQLVQALGGCAALLERPDWLRIGAGMNAHLNTALCILLRLFASAGSALATPEGVAQAFRAIKVVIDRRARLQTDNLLEPLRQALPALLALPGSAALIEVDAVPLVACLEGLRTIGGAMGEFQRDDALAPALVEAWLALLTQINLGVLDADDGPQRPAGLLAGALDGLGAVFERNSPLGNEAALDQPTRRAAARLLSQLAAHSLEDFGPREVARTLRSLASFAAFPRRCGDLPALSRAFERLVARVGAPTFERAAPRDLSTAFLAIVDGCASGAVASGPVVQAALSWLLAGIAAGRVDGDGETGIELVRRAVKRLHEELPELQIDWPGAAARLAVAQAARDGDGARAQVMLARIEVGMLFLRGRAELDALWAGFVAAMHAAEKATAGFDGRSPLRTRLLRATVQLHRDLLRGNLPEAGAVAAVVERLHRTLAPAEFESLDRRALGELLMQLHVLSLRLEPGVLRHRLVAGLQAATTRLAWLIERAAPLRSPTRRELQLVRRYRPEVDLLPPGADAWRTDDHQPRARRKWQQLDLEPCSMDDGHPLVIACVDLQGRPVWVRDLQGEEHAKTLRRDISIYRTLLGDDMGAPIDVDPGNTEPSDVPGYFLHEGTQFRLDALRGSRSKARGPQAGRLTGLPPEAASFLLGYW